MWGHHGTYRTRNAHNLCRSSLSMTKYEAVDGSTYRKNLHGRYIGKYERTGQDDHVRVELGLFFATGAAV